MIHILFRTIGRAVHDTIWHDGIEHAGYLAFLGLLALFPFLVFVVAVIGAVGPETQAARFMAGIFSTLPPEIIRALEPRILEITSGPPQGLLTLAIVGAVWTASSAVEGMRTILNRAYHVHEPPRYLFRRMMSVLQLLVFAFVMIVGMVLLVTLPGILNRLQEMFVLPQLNALAALWSGTIYAASLGMLLCVVACIYYAIPNIRQRWISIWPGAVAVVLLWMGAARLFSLYLTHFNQVTLIYGSLGGIIAAMIFFYICNIIFIFGAELNYHVSQLFGMQVQEREPASEDVSPAA